MFDLKICDLRSAPDLIVDWATKTVSLLDPGTDLPGFLPTPDHLILHFHDIDQALPHYVAPDAAFLETILSFSERFAGDDRVLVHCHAGISRSTAVAIAILIRHGMTYPDAFARVQQVRSILWPNALLTCLTDERFGLGGALSCLVSDFKTQQLSAAALRHGDDDAEAADAMQRWLRVAYGNDWDGDESP